MTNTNTDVGVRPKRRGAASRRDTAPPRQAWVPWSIDLTPFDPNDPEVAHWGTASDNSTTTVDYTGEPVWVRPWWTPAEAAGGEFPDWYTHWRGKHRPTTDRRSTCVFYTQGDDDREGLVGYHTTPKTGDLSPFIIGGVAIVGLIAVGALALSLARRRR